jgi:hypothetical protein
MNEGQKMPQIALTPRLQSAAEAVLAQTISANGVPVPHDPHNADHIAFMEELALRHGYTPSRYPALFASFRKPASLATTAGSAANTGAFTDNQIVDYLAPIAANNLASSHALITRTKPVSSMFVAISVMNVNGTQKSVLASGANNTYLKQTTEVQTNDATSVALPTTGTNYATISWSVQYTDGTNESSSVTSQWAYQTASDPVVTAPAINPNRQTGDLNNIMIGLSRGYNSPTKNSDIDYWFWQTQFENTTLLTPFVGSMSFTKPIAPLGSANPQLLFYLARSEGGMSELTASNTQPYMAGFSIDANNPNQLNFSLQATATGAGNAIDFGTSPWVADTQTFFTAKVVVTLNDNTQGWSSVLSSEVPDTNPTDGVTYIKPLVYVWHCLAAGTQITMDDGSQQSIENLDSGMVVRSVSNAAVAVQATLAQPHWGTVYVIQTQGGLSITCSGTHPFITPHGPVQASTLSVGSVVITQSGNQTVSSVTTQQQNGEGLFNLWLAAAPDYSTFYANGFLVGDYQLQVTLLQDETPAHVLARLPSDLHADYQSHLEDIAAKRQKPAA